jgi:type IX secretion system substrate protein
LFGVFQTQAQIVINSNNILGVGDRVIQAADDAPEADILPGEAGEDKTWDFKNLQISSTDTMLFLLPTSTPYWTEFPDANIAMLMVGDSAYVYFDKNTSNLTMLGIALEYEELGGVVAAAVEPGELFLEFPYEYGYNTNETFAYNFKGGSTMTGIDSVRIKRVTVKNSNVDAWGSMSVPMGTYEALRVHETRNITDSIWGKVPFFGWQLISVEPSNEERYIWWSNDPSIGYILVNLNIDPENGEVMSADFMAEPTFVGIEIAAADMGIDLYPNPVSDYLLINNKNDRSLDYSIYDISGRRINQGIVNGGSEMKIHTSNLKAGIYFLRLENDKYTNTSKIIKK